MQTLITQAEIQLKEIKTAHPLDLLQVEQATTIPLIEQLESKLESKLDLAKKHKFYLQQQQIDKLKEVVLCPICLDKQKNMSLEPCGHALCKSCVDKIFNNQSGGKKACPLCRKKVKAVHQIYL